MPGHVWIDRIDPVGQQDDSKEWGTLGWQAYVGKKSLSKDLVKDGGLGDQKREAMIVIPESIS